MAKDLRGKPVADALTEKLIPRAAALAEQGIGARKYFYPITTAFKCYKDIFDPNDTPIAYRMSYQVLTLPMYADLSLEDVDRICETVLSCRK